MTTYRYTKEKINRKLCILQKHDLYLNQFSNKKGAIDKPESPKKHPIWAAHPHIHLSTKYPPGNNMFFHKTINDNFQEKEENVFLVHINYTS